jgi:hypothetical protein
MRRASGLAGATPALTLPPWQGPHARPRVPANLAQRTILVWLLNASKFFYGKGLGPLSRPGTGFE